MERLTKRDKCRLSHGEEIVICKHDNKDCNDYCMKIIHCDWYRKAMEKLKKYEDLEEQGLLIKLHCKIGDTFYVADTDKNMIHPFVVKNIHINKYEKLLLLSYIGKEKHLQYWEIRVEISRFEKLFFKTKEEAEKALERMEE